MITVYQSLACLRVLVMLAHFAKTLG